MPIFATAGSALYIGDEMSAPSGDVAESDFSAVTWTEIKPLESIGSIGDTSETVSINVIGVGRVQKIKGTRDAGTMQVVAALDYSDAGQAAVLAAEATPYNYAFRLVFNDAPAGGTPSERMFVAVVLSAAEQLDDANNVMKLNISLGVNSSIARIAAAEA